jgi:hypothetical protein
MKLLTLNFLTCARKSCKSSPAAFPLHPREVELEQIEVDLNPLFIRNMLPRLDWEAMRAVTQEVRGGQISFSLFFFFSSLSDQPGRPSESSCFLSVVGLMSRNFFSLHLSRNRPRPSLCSNLAPEILSLTGGSPSNRPPNQK